MYHNRRMSKYRNPYYRKTLLSNFYDLAEPCIDYACARFLKFCNFKSLRHGIVLPMFDIIKNEFIRAKKKIEDGGSIEDITHDLYNALGYEADVDIFIDFYNAIKILLGSTSSKSKIIGILDTLSSYDCQDYLNLVRSYLIPIIQNTLVFDTTYITSDSIQDTLMFDTTYLAHNIVSIKYDKTQSSQNIFDHCQKIGEYRVNLEPSEYTLPHNHIFVELSNSPELYVGVLLSRRSDTLLEAQMFTYHATEGESDHIGLFYNLIGESNTLKLKFNCGVSLITGREVDEAKGKLIIDLILDLFNQINDTDNKRYNVYSEDTNERPRLIVKNNISHQLLNRPTYIVLNKEVKETEVRKYARKSDSKIEYSFSWIVRGHYRKLHDNTSNGKDIFGRPIQGKTWVESYLKGDKNMPLRVSQYKVKEDSSLKTIA